MQAIDKKSGNQSSNLQRNLEGGLPLDFKGMADYFCERLCGLKVKELGFFTSFCVKLYLNNPNP